MSQDPHRKTQRRRNIPFGYFVAIGEPMGIFRSILLLVLVALATAAAAEDGGVTPQHHSPKDCRPDDSACIRGWFQEYRAGILDEFNAWDEIAGQALTAAQSGNDVLANRLAGKMILGGWYRHNHWDEYEDPAAVLSAGISYDDLEAATVDCRDAIIDLKFFLVAASDGREDTSGWKDWSASSRKCRKYQKRISAKLQ